MKNEYGKKDYQGKGYQATGGKENRNPNAPTQGGFSKTGGDLGQNQKNKFQQGNKPTTPGQSNTWGTGSINTNTDKNKDRR